MRKNYSLPEKYINHVKDNAKKFEIAESEYLRRIIDKDIEEKSEDNKKQ